MWVDLPALWIVVLNVLGIPAIHLGLSWLFIKMKRSRFDPTAPLYRERAWERGGEVYQTVFKIRRWKGLLPDAAPWFDGFAKGKLKDKDPEYLRAFIAETCRGEAAHFAQIPGIMLTLIWNPWPVAAIVMILYAVLSNLPCLLLQRFTRARLRQFLADLEGGKNGAFSHIIDSLNELFITEGLTEQDLVNYAYTIRDKVRESDLVMKQIANNTDEQAMLGDFPKAVDEAIMSSSEAHQNQMLQLLSDPDKAKRFAKVVFDLIKMAG